MCVDEWLHHSLQLAKLFKRKGTLFMIWGREWNGNWINWINCCWVESMTATYAISVSSRGNNRRKSKWPFVGSWNVWPCFLLSSGASTFTCEATFSPRPQLTYWQIWPDRQQQAQAWSRVDRWCGHEKWPMKLPPTKWLFSFWNKGHSSSGVFV